MTPKQFNAWYDSCFDDISGEWIGPKYYSSPALIDHEGNYYIYHYKIDSWEDRTLVHLGPEPWNPEPVSDEASCQKTDALIDRAEQLKASIKTEDLPAILLVRSWDRDCNANISVYRTKRWLRASVSPALKAG